METRTSLDIGNYELAKEFFQFGRMRTNITTRTLLGASFHVMPSHFSNQVKPEVKQEQQLISGQLSMMLDEPINYCWPIMCHADHVDIYKCDLD